MSFKIVPAVKHRTDKNIDISKYIIELNKLLNKNIPTLGIIDEFFNIDTSDLKNDRHIKDVNIIDKMKLTNDKIKTISKIKLNDKYLIKLYKKIKKDVIDFNTQFYIKISNLKINIFDLYEREKKNDITDKQIEEFKKKNLFECIQWSKKYDFPILHNINIKPFISSEKQNIFEDMVSFENDILFKFKNHDKSFVKMDIKSNIDFKDIPPYMNDALIMKVKDIRAIDYRNMDIYHKVKKQIDYYYKRLTKIITKKFDIPNDYVSQAWLKMTEILHKVELIPKDKGIKTFKSFHFCELPGAFINATKYYIKTETNIKD